METDTEPRKPTLAVTMWALASIMVAVLLVSAALGWLAQQVVNGLTFTDAEMTWGDGFGLVLLTWLLSRLWHWGNG